MTPYVSPLREAQAAQTRARILDAAVELFGANGYAGTSLAKIAQAVGVSVETVKQNGPKSALLLASFDRAFSGAEGEGKSGSVAREESTRRRRCREDGGVRRGRRLLHGVHRSARLRQRA